MKKSTGKEVKEVKEDLKKIEKELNRHKKYEEGHWTYKLNYKKSNIIIQIYYDNDLEDTFMFKKMDKMDIKSILKSIINHIYENEINYRNSYIKKTKSVYNRKIKSLALWSSRNKLDRVQKINEELVERYSTTEKMKSELKIYKEYVCDLYSCLTELCPSWKIEDIKKYINEQLEKYRMKNIKVFSNDKYLVVCDKNDKRIVIGINNYSRRDEIWEKVIKNFYEEKYINDNSIIEAIEKNKRKMA